VATTAPFSGADIAQTPNTPKNNPIISHPTNASFLIDSLGRGGADADGAPAPRYRSDNSASKGMGFIGFAAGCRFPTLIGDDVLDIVIYS